MTKPENNFDIVVIGGGPAGILAAISARIHHPKASICLLEKNPTLGKKLLATGNGRCNITNAIFDINELITKYGKNGRFLFDAFHKFGPKEIIQFFETKGLRTVVENFNKVFPKTENAQKILEILGKELEKNKVKIFFNTAIKKFITLPGTKKITKAITSNPKHPEIFGENFILTTGGKSYPKTGSTGDGYALVSSLGHTVTPLYPALTPLNIKDIWIRNLQGITFKNIQIEVYQKNRKQFEKTGDILFTHFGISSPTILLISKSIGELLKKDSVEIHLNFFPKTDIEKKLLNLIEKNSNKTVKNILHELDLPEKFILSLLENVEISPNKKVNIFTKEERQKIAKNLRELNLTVESLRGFSEAVITSGGIFLKEIDPKTMKSKISDNLYFAGEIIDIDGPTGGFNLQIAWSTGYLAGQVQR